MATEPLCGNKGNDPGDTILSHFIRDVTIAGSLAGAAQAISGLFVVEKGVVLGLTASAGYLAGVAGAVLGGIIVFESVIDRLKPRSGLTACYAGVVTKIVP